MNSMESQRYYNNIKDKTIHLKEKNGGILLNIKQHWLPIVTTLIIIAILLMVTFARANEGLDNYENELNKATEQYLSKGPSSMNIYNKVTLSVILVITILISFIFYF